MSAKADVRIQLRQPPTFIFPGSPEYLRNEIVLRLQPDEAIYAKIVCQKARGLGHWHRGVGDGPGTTAAATPAPSSLTRIAG